ncbi:glycosyltransferase family 4 protein [Microvirga sp. M2]|uniref:glycosyltransferase family 4 protein n=1 Tax=Microvirga sp. M2 TaxID=3073270 RepID=UPI0039C1EED1
MEASSPGATEVCILSNSWRGGSGWFTHELASSIAKAGLRVTLIAPPMLPPSKEAVGKGIDRRQTPRVESADAGLFERRMATLKRLAANVRELWRARGKAQVYLFNFVGHAGFELPISLLVRLWGQRLVLVVHDPVPHMWVLPSWARFLERLAFRLDFSLATHIVCLSSASRNVMLKEYGLAPERVTVIPHGAYDLGTPSPLPRNGKILVFGFIRPNKLVRESILAVQKYRRGGGKLQLLVVGSSGPAAYTTECLELAKCDPTGTEVDVRFVPEEEISSIIAEVDAVLLPYRDFNSQSGVAVLAGLSARPVIASDAGGLADLFEMGLAGVRMRDDPSVDAIADALHLFQKRPLEHWEREARAARGALLQQLGWTAIGGSYASLIRRVAGSAMNTRQFSRM